ncbi:hypothetical protein BGAL_0151g00160 [Botrytis galanthina]|uniref:Uncharacterized protein n=1 Tax=Botrytis galanthina TaxID=278940 RepID=A0A4S8QZF8_9HELO|nr:hypothetical protein BGAL_0151g00160 [Botrytis galanthina]
MDNGAGLKNIGKYGLDKFDEAMKIAKNKTGYRKQVPFNSLKRLATIITHKNPNGQSRTLIFLEMPRSLTQSRLFYHQKASRRTCMQVFMQLTPYDMLTFSAPKQEFTREAEAQFLEP